MSDEPGSLPHAAPAGDVKRASYEAGADAHLQQSPPPGSRVRAYRDQLADLEALRLQHDASRLPNRVHD